MTQNQTLSNRSVVVEVVLDKGSPLIGKPMSNYLMLMEYNCDFLAVKLSFEDMDDLYGGNFTIDDVNSKIFIPSYNISVFNIYFRIMQHHQIMYLKLVVFYY